MIMVPHVDKYYEARITKIEWSPAEKQWKYYLHYMGWNKRWDEWVEEAGIMAYDEKLIRRQELLQGGQEQTRTPTLTPGPAESNESQGQGTSALGPSQSNLPSLPLPALLKKAVLADWQQVVQGGQPYELPRNPSVESILQLYLMHVKSVNGNYESEEDTLNGLRLYLDMCLPTQLLYQAEQAQAADLQARGMVASSVFGVEHLLRLLVKLPQLLHLAGAPAQQQTVVQIRLQEFIKWLTLHVGRFQGAGPLEGAA